MTRNLRTASAGALLAQQLRLCIAADARHQPYPPVEDLNFESTEEVARAYEAAALIIGVQHQTALDKTRLVLLFQALAKIIAVQGSDLEASFYNLINQEGGKYVVRQYVAKEGTA